MSGTASTLGLVLVDSLSGRVTVSNSAGTHALSIVDNDFATISLTSASTSTAEGDGPVQVGVNLDFNTNGTGPITLAREVTFALTAGATSTAQSGVDYTLPATLAFAAGSGDDATQTLVLQVLDDALAEGSELANLTLAIVSDGTGGRVTAPAAGAAHALTIADDDIDLKVTATGPAGPVIAGSAPDNLTFTFTVQNTGATKATNVQLSELFTLPAGVTFSSAATSAGTVFGEDGSGGTWSIPALAANESATLTVKFTAASSAPDGGTVTLSGSVALADQTLVNVADDIATVSSSIIRQADLAVSIVDSADPVEGGAPITYTITVVNHGPSDNTSAALAAVLPPGLVGVTWVASLNGAPIGSGSENVGLLTAIPAQGIVVVTVTGVVKAPGNTSLINQASITSTEDPDLEDNVDIESTLVHGVDLKLAQTSDVEFAQPGRVIKYTLTYRNGGFITANGVHLIDLIPAHTVFDLTNSTPGWQDAEGNALPDGAAAGTQAMFPLGSVPVSESDASVVLAVRVLGGVAAGAEAIANSATIADNGAVGEDASPGDNEAGISMPLVAAPDLRLSIINDPSIAQRGGTTRYELTYSNRGNQDATGVFLTVTLPANTSFDPWNSTGSWTNIGGDVYRLGVGSMFIGQMQTSVFAVTLNASIPGGYNAVAVSGTVENGEINGPEPLSDNTDTESTPIYQGIYAVSPDSPTPRKAAPPVVRVFDIRTGIQIHCIQPYDATYRGSIRIAVGDLNGDGFDDIITSTGVGNGQVRVFDGVTGARFEGALAEIAAFPEAGSRGAFVASGDYNGDGRDDIIVGSGQGARGVGKVGVFDGVSGLKVAEFSPFAAKFRGGVRVAAGDVNGDGVAEIIAAQGPGGNDVLVTTGPESKELLRLQIGGSRYRGGLFVAAADFDRDGLAEIITGRDRGPAIVETFGPSGGEPITTIAPFGQKYRFGARVAAMDVNSDGLVETFAGTGRRGNSQVIAFDAMIHASWMSFEAFPAQPNGAIFVAATSPVPFI